MGAESAQIDAELTQTHPPTGNLANFPPNSSLKSGQLTKFSVGLKNSPLGRFGGAIQLAEVRIQEGEPLENALRRFKRKVQQEDIIKEVKRHSYYLKPGEKKRVKEALARKRNRKKARREQD
jgi:small subunit ribosomal protein S21